MNQSFEVTGGARLGWIHASWPLARLTATSDTLLVSVGLLGNYRFTPDTVVSIVAHSGMRDRGIHIRHCVPEYPENIVFKCMGAPDRLLTGIHQTGFLPRAPASAQPLRRGFTLRWQAIVVMVIAWTALSTLTMIPTFPPRFLRDMIPWMAIAIVPAFATTVALIRIPAFQHLVIKPGRNVGEIRPVLILLLLANGGLLLVLAILGFFQQ